MTDADPPPTQRDLTPTIADELDAAGLENAQEIGRGGFGVVYRCEQRSLGRTVAVKVLSADLDDENRERFLREEHAMGKVSGHPNIVDILHVDVTLTGRPYIVMPFHARGSLDTVVRDDGPLGWAATLRIGVKLAGAVESAHRVGILHRDVKPANVLVTDYGEPQLTDFGIARMPGGFETSTHMIAGSPAFTAPEVLKGLPPTPASDIYGLGATLFCLITGHAAFERRTGEKVVAQFLRITTDPLPDMSAFDIPSDVAAAIEAAMASEPANRPATAADFGQLLAGIEATNGLAVDDMALLTGRPAARAPTTGVATSATKFRPPPPTRVQLPRTRLLDQLRAGRARRLTLIHAPAGFGKSSLAAQWREVLTGDDVSVGWLSIDSDDNNVVWFLTHLVDAITRVRPDIGSDLTRTLEEGGEQYVLGALIEQVHVSGRPVAIVVDDWHRITDDGVVHAMEYLLDNSSRQLRLIVTSRSRSGLPLSRMRVRDEIVEIDTDALRLTEDECSQFLIDLHGCAVTDAQVAKIFAATEGWMAAVKLVALSLHKTSDPVTLIDRLSGNHREIGEYLAENVLDTIEPKMLEFLMSLSIVERVSGSLAATLSDQPDALTLLEEADRRDLFLHRIDEDPDWFRFQLLFAEFLRTRLERKHPGRTRILHLRASGWFATHQMLREAVDHAVAATELDLAMDLIESGGNDLIEHSRIGTLLGVVGKLPVQKVAARSRLLMTVARANVGLQHSKAARSALDRITNAFTASTSNDAEQRIEADVLNGATEAIADRTDGVDALVAECLSQPDDVPAWVVSLAANTRSYVLIHDGKFVEARELQTWAVDYHARSNDPLAAVYGHCLAGMAAREQLDIAAAAASFRAARKVAPDHHSHAMRLASAMLGQLVYDQGDLVAAERLLDDSHRPGTDVGAVDFLIATLVTGARIKALRGDLTTATARLAQGAAVAEQHGLPRLAAWVDYERARWRLPRDVVAPSSDRRTAAVVEAATIVALLDEHRLDSDEEACRRARALLKRTTGPFAAVQATLLLAASLAAAGWTGEAKDVVVPAVGICAELGLPQVLRDGGARVVALVASLLEVRRNGQWPSAWPDVPQTFLADVCELDR
ncbi:serine/threonine-protein kinase [Antrihabitans cavernicola]|uniref:non-specific serine/threonine protein kinase n=1 Tax=Antrihabitans cavernicola TaxID=2495913 RepID=A0A5A7SIF9_9NOCA|nr:serine/threonine-protein kinase [Spelaeibacter cavernicola]KAA0024517.1 protein kinase [Spelaeibacter cavernicola]